MAEETPIDGIENWEFPEEYVQRLEELEPNTPYFNIVQGNLYDRVREHPDYTVRDATELATALNTGDKDKAFEILNQEGEYSE